ncbi:hypothetical protein [Microseira wollei]|uniref:Uncharacterized protein n=1 Tax=Microseira wollei NIES-4236 TaxID=2530354 RepID=A0AAV3XDE3_9CYAN|nr:hypothetical protein [Microseira wollei]GET39456.1 hypothetical protein MiSe_42250 [Microseira wollei NIES-4236]
MTYSINQKDELTEKIRQTIAKKIPEANESDRAEVSLCTLSFQSSIYPQRHVWIDTDDGIKIDLEDWQDESEWDNAVARITVESIEELVDLVRTWLGGENLEQYSNVNKEYKIVKKIAAIST